MDTDEYQSGGQAAGRLLSLDVFRGLTIAGMILVNNPGPSGQVYWPLEHAAWHGWTPTDLIFPFFLFIVGVSITLAFARRVEHEGNAKRDLYFKILRRTVLIYAFGFLLAGFPYFNLSTVRLSGVLQRIAVCYFFAAVIFLNTKWRTQLGVAVALLLLYWGMSEFIATPGYAAGDLSKEGSIASFVDRVVLGNHIWKGGGKIYDPEGILSTIPAIATTLTGMLAGHWLQRERREAYEKVSGLFVAGVACVVVGWAWNAWFPINKALWTSSYVVFTTGMALELLAFCYWLVDIKKYKRWALPFVIFGVNALAVFVLSGLAARMMNLWKMPRMDGRAGNLQTYIYEHLFASWATPAFGSMLYALLYVLIWLGLMAILYRRKIFLKV
ncbi:MAG TPA: heparan-alpha-glucosaminide N-acetyltransferase domain-containing protein [Pyrinomonadaceae bacterium]|nr:heparan-alpha-glucosaminide N-acetyltransferase domain-containing protein [Pyrinomonadaceae bacterium]